MLGKFIEYINVADTEMILHRCLFQPIEIFALLSMKPNKISVSKIKGFLDGSKFCYKILDICQGLSIMFLQNNT